MRQVLLDIRKGAWDTEMAKLLGVPPQMLPEVVDCAGEFGVATADILGAPVPVLGLTPLVPHAARIDERLKAPAPAPAAFRNPRRDVRDCVSPRHRAGSIGGWSVIPLPPLQTTVWKA